TDHYRTSTVASLARRVLALEEELYEVKLAAAGGESVPGYAQTGYAQTITATDVTITATDVERWRVENDRVIRQQYETIAATEARLAEAEKRADAAVARLREVEGIEGKYRELLYAVGRKYPGETRHDTALRYIRQAESAVVEVATLTEG